MIQAASSELKQFFRILVSGYVCLLYYWAMLLTYSEILQDMNFKSASTFGSLISIAVSGLALSVPLGFLIHESDVFLYRGVYRPAHVWISASLGGRSERQRKHTTKADDMNRFFTPEAEAFLESVRFSNASEAEAHLAREVSNRWSYFYARLEAGIYAPVFALFLFEASVRLFKLTPHFTENRIIWGTLWFVTMAILLVAYCPRLMKEISAIESLILNKDRIETLRRESQFE
jgi:hypothetical protein